MIARQTVLRPLAIVGALLTGIAPASAHGFAGPGWLHPLTGPDHMLAMLAVGAWSAQVGGRAIWIVPSAFVGAMSLGGALGLSGIALPATEMGIALSVLCLGAVIAAESRVANPLAAIAVGLFGLCHGSAHGLEMPTSQKSFGLRRRFPGDDSGAACHRRSARPAIAQSRQRTHGPSARRRCDLPCRRGIRASSRRSADVLILGADH